MTELREDQIELVSGGDPFTVGLTVGAALAVWEWGKNKKWWG